MTTEESNGPCHQHGREVVEPTVPRLPCQLAATAVCIEVTAEVRNRITTEGRTYVK